MASSLGIAYGGSNRVSVKYGIPKRCSLTLAPPSSVGFGDRVGYSVRKGRISAVAAAAATAKVMEKRMSLESYGKREGGSNDAVEAQERLDNWMRASVSEIVKNLKDAPLLVQVYPKSETATLATEKKVVVEDWPAVKERWESGETPLPEGVIFVEELGGDETENDGEQRGREERTTRAWGIVVQGKGVGCDPVCYLLKTSRVGSGQGHGMGICSTHFCLVKVKNFRETVQSQLKNCWLLQSQWR
ncbi:uncharacterized protein LOC133311067 [Gastrolobium bilobum]|uniref:uncharacterized protein LOC133311067 n=1 Tax=Gastrolobium bilobum TaxID=150636 RepID=UPI002AAF0F10|nr:uncharacterized protein LOC133311067 [Gastrolobium bilobum]